MKDSSNFYLIYNKQTKHCDPYKFFGPFTGPSRQNVIYSKIPVIYDVTTNDKNFITNERYITTNDIPRNQSHPRDSLAMLDILARRQLYCSTISKYILACKDRIYISKGKKYKFSLPFQSIYVIKHELYPNYL